MIEVWERFSFYGIRPLLVLFMAAAISSGGLGIEKVEAAAIVGIFGGCIYLAALPGGWLADNYFGQKKAVFFGAIIIALGHLSIALSIFHSSLFFLGLAFIVIGTGLFKTCASVMVGMLYSKEDLRRDSGFTIFYMGINLGAFIAPLITGLTYQNYGWHLGFGIGGVGMLIALLIFYFKTIPDFNEYSKKIGLEHDWDKPLVKNPFVSFMIFGFLVVFVVVALLLFFDVINIKPTTIAGYMISTVLTCTLLYFLYLFFFTHLNSKEKKNLFIVIILFIAAAFFWSAFEQKPTSFNLFAQDFTQRIVFGWEIPTPWFQSLNAFFIIIFAPILRAFWIILAKKNLEINSISKFALGCVGAGTGFLIMVFASKLVLANGGQGVSLLWITSSILFLTLGELCLSPVGLSIMTKIAPKAIKNSVMGLWFVASSLGNVIAGLIGGHVSAENIQSLPNLFGTMVCVLSTTALVLFIIKKPIYKMINKEV